MANEIYCPECRTNSNLGVIRHEVITINPDSNTKKYPNYLPMSMAATVKCFNCNIEFEAIATLEFEFNPF